ncbi:GNAT family N-acetyltransferase [Peribacillus alkalitolerans]|uniref:GNAT family N-acetyltransferase n=1 Tax=Peribacillus alkalitolerans TaxID=1550385 RepID=UPI0013D7ECE9|nr:N-acetyltransferase [Peribacillus alkalitolerans]
MNIRTETPNDYKEVFHLNYLAFENREDESKLIERIRESEDFIPELTLVAEDHGEIVGHIMFSNAKIINGHEETEVIALGPVAVSPDCQKKGIGGLLIKEGLRRSKEMGFRLVFLIGHPTYYPRFGFKPAGHFGFQLKQFQVPEDVFMVYELLDGELERVSGELRYSNTFLG